MKCLPHAPRLGERVETEDEEEDGKAGQQAEAEGSFARRPLVGAPLLERYERPGRPQDQKRQAHQRVEQAPGLANSVAEQFPELTQAASQAPRGAGCNESNVS